MVSRFYDFWIRLINTLTYLGLLCMQANKRSLYVAYPKTNSLDWTCMTIDLNLGSRWSGGLILIEDNHS
jgi:hypothetical protein